MYGGYRAVFSTIWTEETGREWNRLGHQYHKVAFYLLTGPLSNSYGLYYLPLIVAAEHTGLTAKNLQAIIDTFDKQEFAHYDPATEWVWVRNMIRYQFFPQGQLVHTSDNRVRAICKFYASCPSSSHLGPFFDLYGEALGLTAKREGKYRIPPAQPVGLPLEEGSPSAVTSLAPRRASKPELFDRWYAHYPKKVGKKTALVEWMRIPQVDEVWTAKAIATLEWQCRQPEWVKENGQYIPDPERYLKRGRWQDEPRDQVGLTDRDARTANVLAEWAAAGDVIVGEIER